MSCHDGKLAELFQQYPFLEDEPVRSRDKSAALNNPLVQADLSKLSQTSDIDVKIR